MEKIEIFAYRAKVLSVYDGDTIRVKISLGFGLEMINESIRLFGINTPELRGETREAGLISRDYLRELILDKEITLITVKDSKGKYGRYLGTVYIDDPETGESIDVNNKLIEEGYAEVY